MNLIKSILIRLMISLRNVELNSFKQDKNHNYVFYIENQAHQNQLAADLLQGRVTQEVKDLRWRMYKILEHVNDFTIIVKQGENGTIEYERKEKNFEYVLSKVKVDPVDNHRLVMCIKNNLSGKPTNELVDLDSNEIDASRHHTMTKPESRISVYREHIPKFRIEQYASKLNVRHINENTYMIEFYINAYKDDFNRTYNIFINNIKQTILNPRSTGTVDIDRISFITSNDIGVRDNRLFEFSNIKFDKIIEFDGNYVIKFIGNADKYEHSIVEEFREVGLDMKYETNAPKNDKMNFSLNFNEAETNN